MRKLIAIFLLSLAACASPTGEGAASRIPGMVPTDAAQIASNRWMITCQYTLSECTWRAGQLCPAGYQIAGTQAEQAAQVNAYGAMTYNVYHLGVACK